MRALRIASFLLLVIARSAPAAWAQEVPAEAGAPGQTEADADKRAAVHYEAGIRALVEERDAEAHAELSRAWELKKHFQIAANLGEVELRMGKYREAVEHLEYFLREAQGVRGEDLQRAEGMLREARRQVEAQQREREAKAAPAATVVPERQDAGSAGLGAGVASSGGGEAASGSRPLWWPAIAAAGVGVVGIGVGVGFTIAANARAAEAANTLAEAKSSTPEGQTVCPGGAWLACRRIDGLLDDKERFTGAAIAGYAVGGIAAAGAAVLLVRPIRVGEDGTYVSVAPATGPGVGALFLKGTF